MAATTESDILYRTLSQYTQRPLYEVPSVTGSGGSPPPETPGIHCETFALWVRIFLSGVGMEKRTTSNRKVSASKKAAMTPAEEKASMRKKGARKAGVEQTAPGTPGRKPAGKKPAAKKPTGSKPAAKSPAAKSPAGPRPGKAPRKRK